MHVPWLILSMTKGSLSFQVSQNLYYEQNHEFETKNCENLWKTIEIGKIIGFTDLKK